MTKLSRYRSGFTLVELAIVLVIIGLIIGGVLVGQTLVRTAQLRSFVTQIEKYNAAGNAFKIKAGCLPGDCLPTVVTQLGLPVHSANPHGGGGNGNGQIGDYPSQNALWMSREVSDVWAQLGTLNLIDGTYTPEGGDSAGQCSYLTNARNYPLNNANGRGGIIIASIPFDGFTGNYYWTGVDNTGGVSCDNVITKFTFAFTPSDAYYIDNKIDDGTANGRVGPTGNRWTGFSWRARWDNQNFTTGDSTSCYSSSNNSYSTNNTDYLCNLYITVQF